MDIAKYCYVLETGTIAYEGLPDELRQNDSIVEAYLG